MESHSGPDRETTLLLVALGCLMGLLGEAVSYFIVYSNEEFKRLHKDIIKLWKEYYMLEAECGGGADGRVAGRAGRAASVIQGKIQKKNKTLNALKQKGTICVTVLFLLSMPLIHSSFEGAAGAYLPFSLFFPFTMFQYTKGPQEEGPLVPPGTPQAESEGPPICTTSAIFMISMVLSKMQIQKILGVTSPGGYQQQAALGAPAS